MARPLIPHETTREKPWYSKGQLRSVFTPYKAPSLWCGNRFDKSKLHSTGGDSWCRPQRVYEARSRHSNELEASGLGRRGSSDVVQPSVQWMPRETQNTMAALATAHLHKTGKRRGQIADYGCNPTFPDK
jgi:hypothetical protein